MELSTCCPTPAGAVLLRDPRAWHGSPSAVGLNSTRLLAARWQYCERYAAGWQYGATLVAMLTLHRWSVNAHTQRRQQATEEEAAVRYVRYVQDLLWHAVRQCMCTCGLSGRRGQKGSEGAWPDLCLCPN